MQDYALISFFVGVGILFILLWAWMAGRMFNVKLRNKIARDISTRFRSLTSKISIKILGSTGAKLSLHQKPDSPFTKLETTILLLDRSNIFHMVYCKLRHRTDQLQIRANLKGSPPLRLELVTISERRRLDQALAGRPRKPLEVKIDYLADRFYILSYTPQAVQTLFSQKRLRERFEKVAPYLTRISIASREPHLFISVILVPEAMEPMEDFAVSLARALHQPKK